jgi:predicted nucleic acid-binding protein
VIVLDTNVTSELMRVTPSLIVMNWLRAQDPTELHSTAISVAQIRYGIERLPNGVRKNELVAAAVEVFGSFPDHVLAFDLAADDEYGDVVAGREGAGTPINGFDAQIASICRAHGAALATRNAKDFGNVGLDLTNPWEHSI